MKIDDNLVCKDSRYSKQYFLNGKLHREDGPAIEYVNGDLRWYLNGNRHREDGPAIESTNCYFKFF